MTFPRWAAPLVGALVGTLIAARAARRGQQEFSPEWAAGGAILGFLAGGLIWLVDRPAGTAAAPSSLPAAGAGSGSGSLISRLFALLSVLLWWVPFVGLGLGVGAVLMNLKARGWPRLASWVGAVLSAVVTVVFLILLNAGSGR